MSRMLGIGSVTVDQVSVMDGLPEADRKQEAVQTWHQVGGPVPVALVQAMRFGHTATFMGKWAADMNGGLIEADFAREGLALHPALLHEASLGGYRPGPSYALAVIMRCATEAMAAGSLTGTWPNSG